MLNPYVIFDLILIPLHCVPSCSIVKYPMLKRILLTIFTFFLILPMAAKAQNNPAITIAPSLIELDVEALKEYEETITVTNTSDLIIPVNVEIADYTFDENGVPDYSEDETAWGARTWVKAELEDFILEPGESEDITLNFTIPKLAEPGSHLIAIFFKPVLPPSYFAEQSSHVIPYIGAVASLDVRNDDFISPDNYLEINEFNSNKTPVDINFDSNVTNNDVYFHRVEGVVTLTNLFNNTVKEIPIDRTTILPKNSRNLKQILSERIFPGRYKVDIQITDMNEEVSDSTVLWVYPTILEIFLGLVVLSVITFLIIKRKNISKAIKVLSKRETSNF